MSNSVILLNESKTTAFIPGEDKAVAVLRQRQPGTVVVYNSREEFFKKEGTPNGITPWVVKDLTTVHPHILNQFVAAIEGDRRFANAVKALKSVKVPPTTTRASVTSNGTQTVVANGGAIVVQDQGDARVILPHWFYARSL